MKTNFIILLTLLISIFVQAQITPDFEPCISSGGSSGLNNLRLLVAKSSDGINWTRTNLVLSDRASVADGLLLNSGRILVYYVAGCIEINNTEQPANHIKVAFSDDNGRSWNYKNVTFNNLPSGGTLPVDPNVVLLDNGDIHMLVTIDPDQTGPQKPCTYAAISTDGGFTFTLSNSSVFSISGTDVLDPENFRFGPNNWRLWAGGIPGRNVTGISTNEAISFNSEGEYCSTQNQNNPSECYIVADVIKYEESTYKMYTFGTSPSGQIIRSLTSTDGEIWNLDPEIILSVQPSTGIENLDVWAPTVIKINQNYFLMIYETQIPYSAVSEFSYINILQNDTTLSVNENLNLTARSYYSDNTIRDITFFGTWQSSNPEVAEIDQFGKLTAHTPGNTEITINYKNSTSNPVIITVNDENNFISSNITSLNVYPNPVNNFIVFENISKSEQINFKIVNITGQTIYNGNCTTKTIIDASKFNQGMYIIVPENPFVCKSIKIIKE
ncbi:MAG TPA: Ig-like domain-containing protein [Bacteroidales bacterium]|jgi:hypothetical protein|nr:Ig-like domain-containing protein [Bacteroidales bacterium]